MTLKTVDDEKLTETGKKMTDFSDDLSYTAEESKIKATGTLKKVTEFTWFNTDPAEQNGYYLPFTATPTKPGGQVKVSVNGKPDKSDPDNVFIIFLGTDEQGKSKTIEVKTDDGTATIDMSALELGE